MCKIVAELAGADTEIVRELFARLENGSGRPFIDVRLTGEIYGRIHMKMRALGLDPNDTTPRELYQSLLNLTALHDSFLAKRLGITDTECPAQIGKAVAGFIERTRLPKQSWAFKHTTARRLLKATPPKVLMKLLHYRSLDSMLKREPVAQLLAVARHTEPATWQKRFVQSYKKLYSGDFELRDIEVVYLSDARWESVAAELARSRHTSIVHAEEAGAVALLPIAPAHTQGLTLASLLLSLHYICEIRAFSTYAKFNHLRSDFGALLVDHLLSGKQDHVFVGGQGVHWRVVHRYYGSVARIDHPELFEPHVQPEDMAYRKAEDVLYHLEPALHFWQDSDYVGLPTADGPVSFSLTDMAMNLVNHVPFENRVSYHLQGAIWNEIYFRYVGERSFERQVLNQLDQPVTKASPVLDMEFVW